MATKSRKQKGGVRSGMSPDVPLIEEENFESDQPGMGSGPHKPGSFDIRPSRKDIEASGDAFYRLFDWIKKNTSLTNEEIAEIMGLQQENLETAVSQKRAARKFSNEERQALSDFAFARHLFSGEQRKFVRGIKDAFYFSFLNYFNAQETSQDTARAQIIGTYRLWRYSVEHDGEFVCGRLDFFEDRNTQAVKVRLSQPQKPGPGKTRGSVATAGGYLFRVSHMYLTILKGRLSNDFRATVWPRFRFDEVGTDINPNSIFPGRQKHLINLDGFALGIDGSSGYFSPVHLSLVDDVDELAHLNDELDVVPLGHPLIPDRVAARLSRNGTLKLL